MVLYRKEPFFFDSFAALQNWWWKQTETFLCQGCRAYIFKYSIDMSWPRWKLLKSVFNSILLLHINCEQDYSLVCHSSCSGKKKKVKEKGENRSWTCLSAMGPAGQLPKLPTPLRMTAAFHMYCRASSWYTKNQQNCIWDNFFTFRENWNTHYGAIAPLYLKAVSRTLAQESRSYFLGRMPGRFAWNGFPDSACEWLPRLFQKGRIQCCCEAVDQ